MSHKDQERIVDFRQIRRLSDRIAQEFRPERIVLFGSHALGTAHTESDVDLLVIMPFEGKGAVKSVEILNRVNPRFPVDLLVRTPEQIRQRLSWNDFFLHEILDSGKVLYEATDTRMG